MRRAAMNQNALFPSGMNISNYFLPKLKPPMMTEDDVVITVNALTHFTALCQPESRNSFIEIIRSLEQSKVLQYENIPIVRMALEQVRQRYIDSQSAAIQNNVDKENLCPIYREKINSINIVLNKL